MPQPPSHGPMRHARTNNERDGHSRQPCLKSRTRIPYLDVADSVKPACPASCPGPRPIVGQGQARRIREGSDGRQEPQRILAQLRGSEHMGIWLETREGEEKGGGGMYAETTALWTKKEHEN